VILKRRKSEELGRFEVPLFVPVLGAIVCFVLIVVRVVTGDIAAPLIAGGLLLGALGIYAAMQKLR
jgi:basic amino acid/polyamine antiporter, APA family